MPIVTGEHQEQRYRSHTTQTCISLSSSLLHGLCVSVLLFLLATRLFVTSVCCEQTHHLRVRHGPKAGDKNVCLDLCDVLC